MRRWAWRKILASVPLRLGFSSGATAVAADKVSVSVAHVFRLFICRALLAGFCADIVELFALVHSKDSADVAGIWLAVRDWVASACFGGAFGGVCTARAILAIRAMVDAFRVAVRFVS